MFFLYERGEPDWPLAERSWPIRKRSGGDFLEQILSVLSVAAASLVNGEVDGLQCCTQSHHFF